MYLTKFFFLMDSHYIQFRFHYYDYNYIISFDSKKIELFTYNMFKIFVYLKIFCWYNIGSELFFKSYIIIIFYC